MEHELIASIVVLALVGLIDALYISWHRLTKKPLVCPLGQHCNSIVRSEWSALFGVRNEVLGAMFYVGVIVGALTIAFSAFAVAPYLIAASVLALLLSLYLVYAQVRILKNYCFYCLLSAPINLLIFLNSVALA